VAVFRDLAGSQHPLHGLVALTKIDPNLTHDVDDLGGVARRQGTTASEVYESAKVGEADPRN
jgi:hypothetical protein